MKKQDDIFLKAAKDSIDNIEVYKQQVDEAKQADKILVNNFNVPMNLKSDEVEDWEHLKDSIASKHAKRFNSILDSLPDREFVRVYVKVLEYFKPKINRQNDEGEEYDVNNIVININRNLPEQKTIDITDESNEVQNGG